MLYWYRKNPDSGLLLNYDDGDYSQGYGQIKEAFTVLKKDDILKPYISYNDFRSSTPGTDIGYNFHVFIKGYQKDLESATYQSTI